MSTVSLDDIVFTEKLDQNIALMKQIFAEDNTFVTRLVESQSEPKIRCALFFFDGMVNNAQINESIVKPITLWTNPDNRFVNIDVLSSQIIQINDSKITPKPADVMNAFLYGDTVVFIDNDCRPAVVNTKGFSVRSSSEPDSEKVLQGPREGFTEAFMPNLSMIRRRLKNHHLKFTYKTVGTETKTNLVMCYIDNLCDKAVLNEVKKRLDAYDIDSALDSNYIVECISDNKYSPFPTVGVTERPDIVAAKLLEGRVAVLVDGSPVAITVPQIFQETFQSNDDYYMNFLYANMSRFLRIFGFFLTISIPAIYLALLTYHQEMIPTKLLFSIASSRQGVPFPTLLEAIVLLMVFEILKEAGTRTPGTIGQTLSIVGALVLGQAAVEARFVSAPMVIVIAFAGITALLVPKLKTASLLLRMGLLLCAALLGLYGYLFGLALILLHLCSLDSFGVPYLTNIVSSIRKGKRDVFFRFPWFSMKKNHRFIAEQKEENP